MIFQDRSRRSKTARKVRTSLRGPAHLADRVVWEEHVGEVRDEAMLAVGRVLRSIASAGRNHSPTVSASASRRTARS